MQPRHGRWPKRSFFSRVFPAHACSYDDAAMINRLRVARQAHVRSVGRQVWPTFYPCAQRSKPAPHEIPNCRASSICSARTGRSPAPCGAPSSASRTQSLKVCSSTAAIQSVFLAHPSFLVNAFSASTMEHVFRERGRVCLLSRRVTSSAG